MAAFEIKVGDRLPAIESYLKDADGAAIDLTTAESVAFAFRLADGGSVVEGPATIVNAAGGRVKYAWRAGETATAGAYLGEWRVTYTGGVTMTVPSSGFVHFTVSEDLG